MAESNERESIVEKEHLEHSGYGRYVVVWVLLVVFTMLTYFLSRAHLGPFHLTVALLIAVTKGSLVALFFMHLWDQRGANRLVFLSALVFVALLIGLTVADSATRFPLANPPHGDTARYSPPTSPEIRAEPTPGQLP